MGTTLSKLALLIFLSVHSLLLGHAAFASPWNIDKGEALVISTAENFSSDTFSQISSSAYLEYGLNDSVMVTGKLNYAGQNYGGSFPASASGFTAAEISVQHQLLRKQNTVISHRYTYAAPTKMSRKVQLEGVRYNDITYGNAAEASLLIGHSLNDKGTAFLGTEATYRQAFNGDANIIKGDFVAGFKPNRHWLLMVKSFNTISLGNAEGFKADYDLSRLEPSLTFRRKNGNAYTIGIIHDISGRNLETGSGMFVSFWNLYGD